jgi:hypothetical protein
MGEDQTRDELWNELKILQSIIDKFDDFSFRVKNWFIPVFVAVTGYAIVHSKPALIVFNFGVIFIFYIYEISYRLIHGDFLKRFREVQSILCQDLGVEIKDKTPNIDKYLLEIEDIPKGLKMLSLQKRWGIEEDEAKRNISEYRLIFKGLLKYLFQLRISFIYVAAFLANLIVLICFLA